MLTHVPLVRIDAPRAEIGGGALVALPFADYDELLLGAFTDSRRDYESTAPVFFVSEHDVDAPDGALEGRLDRHLADCGRVRDALALAAPSSSIPDPALSLGLVDIAGEQPASRGRSRATLTRSCCSSAPARRSCCRRTRSSGPPACSTSSTAARGAAAGDRRAP